MLIYSKLHEKSCDYQYKKKNNNKGSPARTGFTKRSMDQGSMFCIQLFQERLLEKKVRSIIPKGNMGYDQYTVSDTVDVEPTFAALL